MLGVSYHAYCCVGVCVFQTLKEALWLNELLILQMLRFNTFALSQRQATRKVS